MYTGNATSTGGGGISYHKGVGTKIMASIVLKQGLGRGASLLFGISLTFPLQNQSNLDSF